MKEKKTGKNIWFFNHYAITPDYPGGSRHFELGKNMAENGCNVVVFASDYIHMSFRSLPIEKGKNHRIEGFAEFETLKFIWIKTFPYKRNNWRRLLNMFSYCRNAYRVSRRLVKHGTIPRPDVIIGCTVHPFAARMAENIARKFHVPFIFEIQDLWPQTFIDMGIWKEKGILSRVFRRIEKQTVRRARSIVVLSPLTTTYLKEHYGVNERNITLIPNGVNVNLYPKENSKLAEKNRGSTDEMKLVYLGGIDVVHDLDTLFLVLSQLEKEGSPVTLYMYGDGKRKDFFMKHYPLPNIKWMGPVKKSQVPGALNGADVLYMSTARIYYGSENKLFEYLASGKPIICSVYTEHNNVVERVGAGISIQPGDIGALTAAVKKMQHLSTVELKNKGKKGRLYVEQHHQWPLLAQTFMDVIDKVQRETTG